MTDIRTCLQRLVDIWDDPNLRHELPGAMWHAKEALKAEKEREKAPPIIPLKAINPKLVKSRA